MATKKGGYRILVLVLVLFVLFFMGDTAAWAGATLKAEPAAAELNPKVLAGVNLVGSGFQAEDRIVIVLTGGKGQDIPVASADADASGAFETKMNMLSILQGIFNFRFQGGKPVPDPNNPPLRPGKYGLKASSWDSKLEAACDFEITAPAKK